MSYRYQLGLTSLFSEKAVATHSSTFAWKILWMEEPGGLQSMGLQRVGHDLAAKQQQLSMQVTNSEECPEGNHSDTIAKYI